MKLFDLFKKPKILGSQDGEKSAVKPDSQEGLWVKCESCGKLSYHQEYKENLKVCPGCGHHGRMSAWERIALLLEPDSFSEMDVHLRPVDPLHFQDTKSYKVRLREAHNASQLSDAIVTGEGTISRHRVGLAAMDFTFMGGSMGSVVGEKFCRLVTHCGHQSLPVIAVCASGGARMQEGIFSLMQMAKVCLVLSSFSKIGKPYISVLTNPTTGGVAASFALQGDVALAEPGALIGFAGPRVIEQTIKQQLPEGFQQSEFLLEKGMVDKIVERKELKKTLTAVLDLLE